MIIIMEKITICLLQQSCRASDTDLLLALQEKKMCIKNKFSFKKIKYENLLSYFWTIIVKYSHYSLYLTITHSFSSKNQHILVLQHVIAPKNRKNLYNAEANASILDKLKTVIGLRPQVYEDLSEMFEKFAYNNLVTQIFLSFVSEFNIIHCGSILKSKKIQNG